LNLFIDTSAILAVFDRDEVNHTKAVSAWRAMQRAKSRPWTSSYVVEETFILLQNRLGLLVALAFEREVRPLLDVVWIHEPLHVRSVERLEAIGRKKVSLVDAASFVVMEEHGLARAFAYDGDFSDQGFQLVRDAGDLDGSGA
jgi:predicted nucleic acid-binding protein